MKAITLAAAATMFVAGPVSAQTSDWTGLYAGGRVGYAATSLNSKARVLFDRNLDGSFGDTITTAAGANAFSPGFCNGVANGVRPGDNCNTDTDGLDYAVHAGGDVQFGRLVVGGLIEYGRSDVASSVTAFSTTPASYTLTREMRGTLGARARLGYDLGGVLPYVTAGVVRARVRSSFATSNTANAFATQNESGKANGYRAGAGFEKRFGPLSIGALYLFTNVRDDDFRVDVSRGTAPLTNPFLLGNAAGTQFRRSDTRFKTHAANLTASFRF